MVEGWKTEVRDIFPTLYGQACLFQVVLVFDVDSTQHL